VPDFDPIAIEEHEKSAWESSAHIYADTGGVLTALSGQAELAVGFGEIDSECRVLDLGCGPGQLTEALSSVAGAIEGVDFADNMIDVAQRTFPDLTFQVANGEELPFEDSAFDVVVVNYTAHHFARPESVFREVLRTLKPQGRVVIIHPVQSEQPGFGSFAAAISEVLQPEEVPGGPLLNVADPSEYITILTACGFDGARCERIVKPAYMTDLSQLLDLGWKMTGLADQPKDIQARIRSGTIARAEKYRTSDGGYQFPDVVLVAVGQVKTSDVR